jgi:hypothetical protein
MPDKMMLKGVSECCVFAVFAASLFLSLTLSLSLSLSGNNGPSSALVMR